MKELCGFGIDVRSEVASIDGDLRLARRAEKLMGRWQERPGEAFPQVFLDPSELEAAYRFFGNRSLSFDLLMRPHVENTLGRCQRHGGDTICVHDTSAFVFNGQREGLGFINRNNRGFLGHFSLMVSRPQGSEVPVPLGVIAVKTWIREQFRCDKDVPQHKLRESNDCESLRWLEAVECVEKHFVAQTERRPAGIPSPIHVMDREGDIYDCLSTIVSKKYRCVVRALSNRKLESEDQESPLLFDALDGLPVRFRQTIQVTARSGSKLPDQRKTYPAREGRTAEVCATAKTVTLVRGRNSQPHYPKTTSIKVVHVFEPNPPDGQEPVEWVLYTTEPIDTDEQVQKVIEIYRQRWLIEEFFKATKTGCAYETRQLETYHALRNALAMTLPLAWEMLLLRVQSRAENSPPAAIFIEQLRLDVLGEYSKQINRPLQANPTLRDVAYAVAGMGGHQKRNGPPGWITLRRGYDLLLATETGWTLSTKTCDQS
jgi:hypothetical protein